MESDINQWYYIDRGAGRIGVGYADEFNISGKEPSSALKKLVLQATENLSDEYIIGRGAHGIVYKAILGDQVFAVKQFEFARNRRKQLRMMCKEIEVLGMYKHRNLIKYADYWIGEEYGLVLYKFMEHGSLHDILHEKNPPLPLTWNARFNIAVGIAEGIAYLHNNCDPPIVHRDIKPKNILIDENMEPIIADFGTSLYRKSAEDSYSPSETRKMLSSKVIGTPGYIAPENAYQVVQGRKSDVYSYGVVLLELITRKKVLVPSLNDERKVTPLVSWARKVWLESGKIDDIADSYLASSLLDSAALTKQVTTMFLLALQCTEKDLRKRPIMKDILGLYRKDMFKWCDAEEHDDMVAADTSPQPSSPNILPNIPVVSVEHHLHGETSRAAAKRQREVPFNVETEPTDYNDLSFWPDTDQFQMGFHVEENWSLKPMIYIDGLLVKMMGNFKIMTEMVLVVAALNVPKVTYVWPSLIFIPSVADPIVTKPFNWFFLSRWGQYMFLHKSLYYQTKLYFINANNINTLQDLILKTTENLNDQYVIGRGAYFTVYKVILGQQVFALKKFEFGRNKKKHQSIVSNEIEVIGNIEMIIDSHLASSFPNSVTLTKQVAPIFLLALCTETDLQKRPTIKDVVTTLQPYSEAVAADTTLQPYSPCNLFSDAPDVCADNHLRGESSRATVHRQREVTFNVKPEPRDNSDFMFWQDADQFSLGVYDWGNWKLMSRPAVSINGLVIKVMGNCEAETKTVVVVALIVPKMTYSHPCLIFLPSIIGPTLRELFNWFFLSQWSQYMQQQKSLYYQSKSYFRNANQIKSLQDLVLVATEKLKEQDIIGRRAHGVVQKAILGEKENACFLSE